MLTRIGTIPCWAFVGLFAGIWKLVLIVGTIVVLYGRSGLPTHPLLRLLKPYTLNVTRSAPAPKARSRFGDRAFILLVVVSATAVVAWIATRTIVTASAGGPPSP